MTAAGDVGIERVVQEGLFVSVFQPLVDVHTGAIFAHEALSRSEYEQYNSPPALFKAAINAGLCGQLGRTFRRMAVAAEVGVPLFLNINPNEFDEGYLVQPDDPIFWHPEGVYAEITESVPLTHFEQCQSVLKEMRSKGVKLAVDDLGAGYSNLKYIADLAPEIVKLDRELIAGVTHNSRQHRLLSQITRLCQTMGARVVAEGVETVDEYHAARDAGVDYLQGYLLARPAYPAPKVQWPPR